MNGQLFRVEALVTQYHGNTDFAKVHYKKGVHLGLDVNPVNRKYIPEDSQDWDVFCPMEGEVMEAETNGPYGLSVKVYNSDLRASLHFAHLESISVNKGQKIKQNTRIGVVGNTGNSTARHLHLGYCPMLPYGVRLFSDKSNPYSGYLDPLGLLMALGVKI
jgi:murein DD-endopeptidase MepM/ murein hydrolase activator NlpD